MRSLAPETVMANHFSKAKDATFNTLPGKNSISFCCNAVLDFAHAAGHKVFHWMQQHFVEQCYYVRRHLHEAKVMTVSAF